MFVGDLTGEQQLPLEPALEFLRHHGVLGEVRPDHLDGHRDLELPVPRLIHRSHPPNAEQSDDVVPVPEVLTDLEGIGRGGKRSRGADRLAWGTQLRDFRIGRRGETRVLW